MPNGSQTLSGQPPGSPAKPQSAISKRIKGLPAWVLLTQLFIGLGWLRAAGEKVIDPEWWDGTTIGGFIAINYQTTLGWYRPLIDNFIGPNAEIIAVVVVIAQIAVAASLLSGRYLGYGLGLGIFLNLNFLIIGGVNPSVFYLLAQGSLALWLAENAFPGGAMFATDAEANAALVKRVSRSLSAAAFGAYALAAMSIPYIRKVEPSEIMRDPAIMLGLFAVLTVLGCDQAYRNSIGGRGLPALNWLFKREESRLMRLVNLQEIERHGRELSLTRSASS